MDDRIHSYFELRANQKIVREAKANFKPDLHFVKTYSKEINELKENGVLYIPNFYPLSS
jgi:hypothetical protein